MTVISGLLIAFCVFLPQALAADAAQSVSPALSEQHILLLYSYSRGKGVDVLDEGLMAALALSGIKSNNLHFEYLDLERNKDDARYEGRLREFLLEKYAGRPIGLIITVQQPALRFLLDSLKPLAPGAPVITLQSPAPPEADTQGRKFICQVARFDIKATIERALELFPKTRSIVFVSGSSEADLNMAQEVKRLAEPWRGALELKYTDAMSLDELLVYVSKLPPDTVIIFTQYNRDTSGRVMLAYEVEGMITKLANAPVFGLYDFNLRNGGIGGSVISVRALGEKTGELAIALLSGTFRPAAAVTLIDNKVIPMFDWRQIRRWGGHAGSLPPDSLILHKPRSIWEQYKTHILIVSGVIVTQMVLILLLLVNIRHRKAAQKAQAQSDERFRVLFENATDAIMVFDADMDRFIDANRTAEKMFGADRKLIAKYSPKEFYAPIQPDGRPVGESFNDNLDQVLSGRQTLVERAIHTFDGRDIICELRLVGMPEEGRRRFRASFIDITKRKEADEAIRKALREKVTLLKEVHHRVKNNMAIISAMLALQARHIDEPRYRLMFKDSQNRIMSMALVHEKLYQRDELSDVNVKDYIQSLYHGICTTFGSTDEVALRLDVQDLSFDIDTLIPFGLILNELFTNAFKHALRCTEAPEISISMSRASSGRIVMEFADNGCGLPEDFRLDEAQGLGIMLVMSLVGQLDGTIEAPRRPRAVFRIDFKHEER